MNESLTMALESHGLLFPALVDSKSYILFIVSQNEKTDWKTHSSYPHPKSGKVTGRDFRLCLSRQDPCSPSSSPLSLQLPSASPTPGQHRGDFQAESIYFCFLCLSQSTGANCPLGDC